METSAHSLATLPVGKIVCVGRNFAEHARELDSGIPSEPVLFLKPPTALLLGGGMVELPSFSKEVHHEVELVLRISKGGKNWSAEDSERCVDAFAVGLDLTARDLQNEAKKKGLPWAVAKGFDGSAPISELQPCQGLKSVSSQTIQLLVNGVPRQRSPLSAMLFSLPELIAFVSTRFRWEPGDLLFTGTPAGVGPVVSGDHLVATIGTTARLELWVK